ncbi:MAG: NAD(P)/FAD-dependent oxidoreductase [Luminiphilus sp.]|nr:NAD(P)/FAD-dependent oxidoreductase [Luminiphilus sp.]
MTSAAMRESDTRSFDPDALREKYRIERDKRIRADGNDQYVEVSGDFSHYVDDPYITPGLTRESITRDVEVVIIGGGFGGMLAAARLQEAGITDFTLIEKGGGFGGTWYWNRYPGASCDIEAYVYLPLLEETGFIPQQKYTNAEETLEYCEVLAQRYGLHEHALLQTQVKKVVWQESSRRWQVTTDRGDVLHARFVIHSNGPLNRPKLPGIKGIDQFKGHTFHTSRWDYAYTGGNTFGGLSQLSDKRVAVIGTGATAVQCVPHLAESAKALYVFQRTPSSIDVRNNQPTDPNWISQQPAGWQKRRQTNFESIMSGAPVKEDLVGDGWTEAFRNLFGSIGELMPSKARLAMWAVQGVFSSKRRERGLRQYLTDRAIQYMGLIQKMEMADFNKMEKVRARADELIADKLTAESLKPYYRQFCKRPCFHDEYLQSFNRDNVTLVDTDGQGVEAFTEKGVVFNGDEYEVDCIIFATGFEVGTDYSRRAGYSIAGVDGLTVSEKWQDGMATFHGLQARGFPNSFFFGPMQSGFTAAFTYALDENSIHAAYIIDQLNKRGVTRVEASEKAEAGWVKTVIQKARLTEDFQKACTPGYYNNEGHVQFQPQNTFYGGGPIEFFALMRKWRRKGTLKVLELRR